MTSVSSQKHRSVGVVLQHRTRRCSVLKETSEKIRESIAGSLLHQGHPTPVESVQHRGLRGGKALYNGLEENQILNIALSFLHSSLTLVQKPICRIKKILRGSESMCQCFSITCSVFSFGFAFTETVLGSRLGIFSFIISCGLIRSEYPLHLGTRLLLQNI